MQRVWQPLNVCVSLAQPCVDVECSRLLDVWLVGVTAVQPAVSRAFKITLPQGGENRIEKVQSALPQAHHA